MIVSTLESSARSWSRGCDPVLGKLAEEEHGEAGWHYWETFIPHSEQNKELLFETVQILRVRLD